MNKNTSWVIEPWHIRVAFRKAGVMVPEEAIILPPHRIAGPDLALQGKEFAVKVKVRHKWAPSHLNNDHLTVVMLILVKAESHSHLPSC